MQERLLRRDVGYIVMSIDYRSAVHRFGTGRSSQAEAMPPYRVRTRGLPNYPVAARRADGTLITLGDLPDPHSRWTRLRKQTVIDCIDHGLLTLDGARRQYRLTEAELGEWRAAAEGRGRAPITWSQRPRAVVGGVIQRKGLEIDLDAQELRVDGQTLTLSNSEWIVLATVAEADGQIVTSAMIMGVLYPDEASAAGIKIVDVLMCRLRRKLGNAAGYLEALWGRGYYLGD